MLGLHRYMWFTKQKPSFPDYPIVKSNQRAKLKQIYHFSPWLPNVYGNQKILFQNNPKVAVIDNFDPADKQTVKKRLANSIHKLDQLNVTPIIPYDSNSDITPIHQAIKDKQPAMEVLASNFQDVSDNRIRNGSSWLAHHDNLILSPYSNRIHTDPLKARTYRHRNSWMSRFGNAILLPKVTLHNDEPRETEAWDAIQAHDDYHKKLLIIPENNSASANDVMENEFGAESVNDYIKSISKTQKKAIKASKKQFKQNNKKIRAMDVYKIAKKLKKEAWINEHTLNTMPSITPKAPTGPDPLAKNRQKIAIIGPGILKDPFKTYAKPNLDPQYRVRHNLRETVKGLSQNHVSILTRLNSDQGDQLVAKQALKYHAPSVAYDAQLPRTLHADSDQLNEFIIRKPKPELVEKYENYPNSEQHQSYEAKHGPNTYPTKFKGWIHVIRRETHQHNRAYTQRLTPEVTDQVFNTLKATKKEHPNEFKYAGLKEGYSDHLADIAKQKAKINKGQKPKHRHRKSQKKEQESFKTYVKGLRQNHPNKYQALQQQGVDEITNAIKDDAINNARNRRMVDDSNGILLPQVTSRVIDGKSHYMDYTELHDVKSIADYAKLTHKPIYTIPNNNTKTVNKQLAKDYHVKDIDSFLNKVAVKNMSKGIDFKASKSKSKSPVSKKPAKNKSPMPKGANFKKPASLNYQTSSKSKHKEKDSGAGDTPDSP